MRHPLDDKIRWVLCAILALWLLPLAGFWVFYSLAIPLFGLMIPVFGAAPSPCSICNDGTQGTTNIQVDLSGVANAACADCSNMNKSFLIPFLSFCSYVDTPSVTLCGSSATVDLCFAWNSGCITSNSAGDVFDISIGGAANAGSGWGYTLSSPRDCQSTTGVTGLTCNANCFPGSIPPFRCDFTLATINVIPLP